VIIRTEELRELYAALLQVNVQVRTERVDDVFDFTASKRSMNTTNSRSRSNLPLSALQSCAELCQRHQCVLLADRVDLIRTQQFAVQLDDDVLRWSLVCD
jgi:hypothetical protein